MEAETDAIRDHGGSLAKARALFPHAPEPWIDLSTGINPHPYKLPPIPASAWERLPEDADIERLCQAAARRYGAPSAAHLVAVPGTQALLPRVAAMVKPGRAAVWAPTYAEHARALVRAGHDVIEASNIDALADADIAVLVNPNNPDGRLLSANELCALARELERHEGMLVVDEAFMDVREADGWSVAGAVETYPNLVVLRSFGKFYGLAGLRLGFAIASTRIAERLRSELGPWAVSGPAVAVGCVALGDDRWASATRAKLVAAADRLDHLLGSHGLKVAGGTSLFRFVRSARAAEVFEACGRAGLYLRRFDVMPDALRFGLPPDDEAFARLERALAR